MMKKILFTVLFCMLLFSPLGAVPWKDVPGESPDRMDQRICLELMDLEASAGKGDQDMELPPLKAEERPTSRPEEPLQLKRVPKVEENMSAVGQGGTQASLPPPELSPGLLSEPPEGAREPRPASSALSPMPFKSYSDRDGTGAAEISDEIIQSDVPSPGISPMILPQPTRRVETEPLPLKPSITAEEAVTVEVKAPESLKALQPPAMQAGSLKVPTKAEEAIYTGASVPEIPLLAEKGTGEREGGIRTQDVALTLKPVKGKVAKLDKKQGSPQGAEEANSLAYYGNWNELDNKLTEIYDKFYK